MVAYKEENKRIVQTSRFLSLSEALSKYFGNWLKSIKEQGELAAKREEQERIVRLELNRKKNELLSEIAKKKNIAKIADEIAKIEKEAGDNYHLIKDVENVEQAMEILLNQKKKP